MFFSSRREEAVLGAAPPHAVLKNAELSATKTADRLVCLVFSLREKILSRKLERARSDPCAIVTHMRSAGECVSKGMVVPKSLNPTTKRNPIEWFLDGGRRGSPELSLRAHLHACCHLMCNQIRFSTHNHKKSNIARSHHTSSTQFLITFRHLLKYRL
ncbi:hypothetical protein CDSM653_00491 [Caldanaerobacter subterraneus subsp. pacificus DSM 12653]|uniref:Uncharacterized protein n=1 Tax=Caldanaerobacter subterraneus subsp. pacificus DSM 12653 TaxID=391606 RepID=A0A0F5PP79_9THEO|nr:hypothetical protein CDSM653_00491 [Caldanaerobacter subterraneus subsp. pacificus DSM 12653]